MARRILRGFSDNIEQDGFFNYKLVAVHAGLSHQQVKNFLQSVELRRLPEDMLLDLVDAGSEKFHTFVLVSAVQSIYGPSRAGAAHFRPPCEILELANDDSLPPALRKLIRDAGNHPASLEGGISHALGIVIGDRRAGVAWDLPFALLGWFSSHGYGRWKDLPAVAEAIRKAAKIDADAKLPDSLEELVQQGLATVRRFESQGSQMWFVGGVLPHGYEEWPEHAEPGGPLDGHPMPGKVIEYAAADIPSLRAILRHPRVLLDLPDPFDASLFDALPLTFHVKDADGVRQALTAGELRRRTLDDLGDLTGPQQLWHLLSRRKSVQLTQSDPANPPDVALLPCWVSSPKASGHVAITLILHTSPAGGRTRLFVTKPLASSGNLTASLELHHTLRYLQQRIDCLGKDSLLSEELRGHRRALEARVRGFPEQVNWSALFAAARILRDDEDPRRGK
jgi:hypothetical protein